MNLTFVAPSTKAPRHLGGNRPQRNPGPTSQSGTPCENSAAIRWKRQPHSQPCFNNRNLARENSIASARHAYEALGQPSQRHPI